MRTFAFLAGLLLSAVSFAGTITITEPADGDFLGRSNQIRFNIADGVQKVRVTAKATQVANPAISVTVFQDVTPDSNGDASGTINLNLADTQPNGPYTLEITASEPGNSYNTPTPLNVTVDVVDPEFINFNPINGVFVRDLVLISALFDEDNIEEWRVKVAGNDIPNNTGNTSTAIVQWDTAAISSDGQRNIEISIEDKAGNKDSKTFSVTIDRLAPSSTVLSPTGDLDLRPGQRIPVVVNVQDQFSNAVDPRGVEVTVTDLQGNLLARVARIGTNNSGNGLTWVGRIRDTSDLPSAFKIVVDVQDRAGNQALRQEVTVQSGRAVNTTPVEPPQPVDSDTVERVGERSRAKAIKAQVERRQSSRSRARSNGK
ncbi:MAG: hypothetical protein R2688_01705 [Fimbriimonadaceae bacterium]